jgi:Predicted metal binding domain
MFLDPAVEQRKFERDLALLRKNAEHLSALGIWLVHTTPPEIDVVCIPRLTLRVAFPMPAVLPGTGISAGSTMQAFELHALSGRAFGLRFDLTGYDQRPPSVTFRDPWTWEPLSFGALPLGMLADDPTRPQQVVLDAHPVFARPFVCLRGVREYHEHPQHNGDDWALYRASINVYVLLERIVRVTLASVRPQILFVPTALGQVNLQVQWAPEALK